MELTLGNHQLIADDILEAQSASAHPVRERLMAYALTALHRSGRGTEAVQAYDR